MPIPPLKICVLGAGALGCAIGAALAEAGHGVWLLNRSAAQAEAIRRHGLQVRSETGERAVRCLHAATRADEVGPVDLVIVLVKSFHTREALAGATALLGPHTLLLSLQNGLGHEDILAELAGRQRVLAGKTYVGGVLLGPGRIVSGTVGKATVIGELDGTLSPRVQALAAAFTAAGLATTVSDNILGTVWDKLLVNVATGAVSAISRLPYGELYQVPELRATALAAVAEALAVARATGVRLGFSTPQQPWDKAAEGLPPGFKASMLQSLEKGSVTEIDFINGAVVAQGARLGVPTPVNAALVGCVKGIERAMQLAQAAAAQAHPTNLATQP